MGGENVDVEEAEEDRECVGEDRASTISQKESNISVLLL